MSVLQLLFAVLLVLANGFFVGAEFALVSVRRSQIEPLGSARARQVLYGLERLPQMMAAAQFGITICSLTLGAVAEPTVAHLLEPVFEAVHLPEGVIHPSDTSSRSHSSSSSTSSSARWSPRTWRWPRPRRRRCG